MIPQSTLYKLVDKKTNIILSMGNSKDMQRLRKNTPNTFVYISTSGKIGDSIK
jgi:hypothetical protein